jgi:SET domain-containing protein
MALLENQLVVKRSTLPGAGKGLFTKKFIPKGTRIVEYRGKVSTWKDSDFEDNGYIYYVKRNHVIDARLHPDELARYANDANGIQKVKGLRNNAEYEEDGFRVFIEATRDIPAGSEILVSYGKEYWQVIRHNMKIDQQQQKNGAHVRRNGTPSKKKTQESGKRPK